MLRPATTKAKTQGFVLLEVLLAFGVSIIIISGMVALGVITVRATTSNKAYAEAGKIAQREVERLKLLRDTSTKWSAFTDEIESCTSTSVCHLSLSESSYTASTGTGKEGTDPSATTFSFYITSSSADMVKYVVTAKWTVGAAAEKTYTIAGALSNWREN